MKNIAYEVIAKFRTLRVTLAQRRVIIAEGKKWADPFCEVFDTLVETERARQNAFFQNKSRGELMIRQLKMSGLINFWQDLVKWFGDDERSSLDDCDFLELGEKHGLIRNEEYDRDRHDEIMDAEEGDHIWRNNFDIDADDNMIEALAAIIGFTGMPQDKPVDREWVLRTALRGFGCDSLDGYLKKVGMSNEEIEND